jgi:hypothetical protein
MLTSLFLKEKNVRVNLHIINLNRLTSLHLILLAHSMGRKKIRGAARLLELSPIPENGR